MDLLATAFEHPEFKTVMAEEQFDLVIFEGMMGDAFIGLGAHFKCPTIVFNSFAPMGNINKFIGNSEHLSFVVNPMLTNSGFGPMNFLQRVMNVVMYYVLDFVWDHFRQLHIKLYE